MVSIPVRRDVSRGAFAKRDGYYLEGPSRGQDPRICKVLELTSPALRHARDVGDPNVWRGFPWVTLVVGSGCLELPDDPSLDPDRLAGEVEDVIRTLIDDELGFRQDQTGEEKLAVGIKEKDHARDFARALIADRLQLAARRGDRAATSAPTREPRRVSPLAARFVLLASQLTRLYYASMARAEKPLSRWEADASELSRRDASELEGVIELCQWHCAESLHDLDGRLPSHDLTPDVVAAISRLLLAVQTGIGEPGSILNRTTVSLLHLKLVTEVAWYLMTMGRGAYPGWTELLFGLLLKDQSHAMDRSRPRPALLRSESQSDPIGTLLRPASLQSWAVRESGASSPRADFYDSIAELLWEQSRVIQADGRSVHPPASVFVTSFDVEVEMAMWAAAREGDSFFVVVPVHVFQGRRDDVARPCWLRGEIRRTADDHPPLEVLCQPASWELLTEDADPRSLHRGPHIVHLSGAPLVILPGAAPDPVWGWADTRPASEVEAIREHIWSGLTQRRVAIELGSGDDRMMVEHAVTTDEYLAIRQAEAELLLTSMQTTDKDARRSRALPGFLTASNPEGLPGRGQNPRFWMLVGVPISDPAIRHRLVSQLSPRRPPPDDVPPSDAAAEGIDLLGLGDPERSSASAGVEGADRPAMQILSEVDPLGLHAPAEPAPQVARRPSRAPRDRAPTGIVVNRRISDDQGHLLYWMGFDVVRDTAASFTQDLRHYAAHLRADGWRGWPLEDMRCTIEGDGGR